MTDQLSYFFEFNFKMLCQIKSLYVGLYGSVRESHCALLSFSILLGVAIVLECSLAVSAFAMAREDRLAAAVANTMNRAMHMYGQGGGGGAGHDQQVSGGETRKVHFQNKYESIYKGKSSWENWIFYSQRNIPEKFTVICIA